MDDKVPDDLQFEDFSLPSQSLKTHDVESIFDEGKDSCPSLDDKSINNEKTDTVPDDLEFSNLILKSFPSNENVLKLIDPPAKDDFASLNVGLNQEDKTEKSQSVDDLSENLLELNEPPIVEKYEDKMSVEIQKLSESLVDYKDMRKVDINEIETENEESAENSANEKDEGFVNDEKSMDTVESVKGPSYDIKSDVTESLHQEDIRLLSLGKDSHHITKSEYDHEINYEDAIQDDIMSSSDLIVDADDKVCEVVQSDITEIDASNSNKENTNESMLYSFIPYYSNTETSNNEHNNDVPIKPIEKELIANESIQAVFTEIEVSNEKEKTVDEQQTNESVLDSIIPYCINNEISKENGFDEMPIEKEVEDDVCEDVPVVDTEIDPSNGIERVNNIIEQGNKSMLCNIIPNNDGNINEVPEDNEPLGPQACLESLQGSDLSSVTAQNQCVKGKFRDVISWRNPTLSALVFSILMFIELGVMWEYSIISLLAYSGLILLITNLCYRIAVKFQLVHCFSPMNCSMSFNKEDAEYCVDVIIEWGDFLHKEIKSIAYMYSFSKNAKVFGMLWILTYIGQVFYLQSLIFIGSLLLFSLPVVYKKFQVEIDNALMRVQTELSHIINKVKSKWPMVA